MHARAATRAVELRLASGTIDAKQAADDLDKLLYAWRGDAHERSLRERVAELRSPRPARGVPPRPAARDRDKVPAEEKTAIHAELVDTFTTRLRDDVADSLAPLELTALVEENADLLPVGPAGDIMQARLADRLLALDLPKRAAPVLEKLMQAAPSRRGSRGVRPAPCGVAAARGGRWWRARRAGGVCCG